MTNILPLTAPIRVAVIGYGLAGRVFHAPLIDGVPGLELACICSSKPEAVHADWPDVRVVPTPDAAFADPAIDLVVIATSNASHHALARAALLAGKHVVVDKPCTVTLAETEDLLAVAAQQNRLLTVYQNRRFDGDFFLLQQVLASGKLGRITHFESHFDRFRQVIPGRWREQDIPGSDLWMDLGAHLVDQALQLFGVPDDLLLDVARQREGTQTNDYFHAQLRYPSSHPGLRVVLHASSCVTSSGPRFAVHGTQGSFTKFGLDTQEDALKAGGRPQLESLGDWGADPLPGQWVLHTADGPQAHATPDVAGNYLQYYAGLRDYLQGKAPAAPVTPRQVYQVMALLGKGAQSVHQAAFVTTTDLR
ncbi:oxidoreductase [Rhodoferax sp. WC2427]|uniref:oxidoreductase n=1 Tax=Rhodoferax sp. WC2427 TaxID=3234144 RepID=UPI003466E710